MSKYAEGGHVPPISRRQLHPEDRTLAEELLDSGELDLTELMSLSRGIVVLEIVPTEGESK